MNLIPKQPDVLRLAIGRLWNGQRCPDDRIGAMVELQQTEQGVMVRAIARLPARPSAPSLPVGARADRLWEQDVVEMFFLDEDGQYLEVELGAAGHYLVLGFDAPRHLVADFADAPFETTHEAFTDGQYTTTILIPYDMFPTSLKAMNAYAILSGQFFAYHPVPGETPDFHQPDFFPFARLA